MFPLLTDFQTVLSSTVPTSSSTLTYLLAKQYTRYFEAVWSRWLAREWFLLQYVSWTSRIRGYLTEYGFLQNVPPLQAALMYELTAPTGKSVNSTSTADPHEKSKLVALRLLNIATQCRASLFIAFIMGYSTVNTLTLVV